MKTTLYFIISALFLGLNFHLSKIVLHEINFVETIFWRFLFASITLFFLAYKNLPSLKVILKNLKGASLVGTVGLLGFNIFLFLGLMNSSAINAALIISLNPALTILFSYIILKTPLKRQHLIGVLISFLGVLYLILRGNISTFQEIQFNYSDLLILIANVFFALHHVWVKKYSVGITSTNFTFLASLFCLIGILFFIPFVEIQDITSHSSSFWMAIVSLGVIGTAVVFYFWNAGVQKAGADQAGIFMNIVPLSTALFAIFFNENLYGYHLISGLCIIVGMLIMKINYRKKIVFN